MNVGDVIAVSSTDLAGNSTNLAPVTVTLPPSPFTLWSTLNPLFATPSGTITGQNWARSFTITRVNSGQGADPVIVGMATPASTFINNGVNAYNVYITAQNALGEQQSQSLLVGSATERIPLQQPAVALMFARTGSVDTGGVMWWAAGTVNGTYDLKYQAFTDTVANVPTDTPALALTGATVTLFSGIIPTSFNFAGTYNGSTGTNLLYAYTVANGSNMDIKYQIFDPSGAPISSLVTAATNVPTGTAWSTGNDATGHMYYSQEDTSAQRNIVIQTIDTVTGALGILDDRDRFG